MADEKKIELLVKYQPKSLEALKLPSRILLTLQNSTDKIGYRLLLYSTPGTGKTSTALLMTKDRTKHDVLYLSGSNDFNVERLRNVIMPFVSGFNALGKQKTVVIDECDRLNAIVQDAFKIILDQAKSVNFIFLTNEVEKMNAALRSRFTPIEYNFTATEIEEQKKNYAAFLLDVIKNEKIEADKDAIKELFKMNFPDFRHVLVLLQLLIDGNLPLNMETIELLSETGKQNVELYGVLMNPALSGEEFYKSIAQYRGREKDALQSLCEPFFIYLNSKSKFDQTILVGKIVANWANVHTTTINKFSAFFACCVEIRNIFK